MKIIHQTIAPLSQSVKAETLISHGDNTLRAVIISHHYNEQCSARLEIWSPGSLSWNFMADIPFAVMETPHKLIYTDDGEEPHHFQADIERLYEKARFLLPPVQTSTDANTLEDAYVQNDGDSCPKCKKQNLSSEGHPEVVGTEVFHRVMCQECGAHWEGKYVLTGISIPVGFDAKAPLSSDQ